MLPKTRSGKIMRRVLKAVVLDRDPGDITTIEDEGSVEEARQAWRALKSGHRGRARNLRDGVLANKARPQLTDLSAGRVARRRCRRLAQAVDHPRDHRARARPGCALRLGRGIGRRLRRRPAEPDREPSRAGGNRERDELPAVHLVGRRHALRRRRQIGAPHHLARVAVVGADRSIGRRGHEDQPAGRHQRAAARASATPVLFGMPLPGGAFTPPCGTRHLMSPVFRS